MSAYRAAILAATLMLASCFYPTTFFRPSADEGGHPRTGCSGRTDYWVLKHPNLELMTEVIPRDRFEVFIWLKPTERVSTNFQEIQVRTDAKTYWPDSVEKRFYKSCSPFCPPEIEINPAGEVYRSSLYVALFPKEVENFDRFTVFFPAFTVGETPIKFPPVTFSKNAEIRYFTINC